MKNLFYYDLTRKGSIYLILRLHGFEGDTDEVKYGVEQFSFNKTKEEGIHHLNENLLLDGANLLNMNYHPFDL